MTNQMNKKQLLHLIDTASFGVTECALFLDTHPDDAAAMQAYRRYDETRKAALQSYADNYGPLTLDTAAPVNHWYWATEPWPWEGGCN